jgi:hypothetical protein
MILKQILYLGHWIIKSDRITFLSYLDYAQKKSNKLKSYILLDIIYCVLRYKISIMEYFQFNFVQLSKEERKTYVGTPRLEEYLSKVNPRSARDILDNKLIFLKTYAPFIKRSYATLADFQTDNEAANKVLRNPSGKVVLKWMYGQCGMRIKVIPAMDLDPEKIIKRLKETGNDFAEEYVVQHKDLMRLAPSGLDTVRIITQLNSDDEIKVLGATLRISIQSDIDNWSAGNIGASIDLSNGLVEYPGFYKDILMPEVIKHPVTGIVIPGFQVPYWKEVLKMAKDAASYDKRNQCIGWDIAITDCGPELIEGNNNWCKVFWQLSAKRGLRSLIEVY